MANDAPAASAADAELDFGGTGATTQGPVEPLPIEEDPIFLPDDDGAAGAEPPTAAAEQAEVPEEQIERGEEPEVAPATSSVARTEATRETEYVVFRLVESGQLAPVGRVTALNRADAAELAAQALGTEAGENVPVSGRYLVIPATRYGVYSVAVETDPRVTVTAEQ